MRLHVISEPAACSRPQGGRVRCDRIISDDGCQGRFARYLRKSLSRFFSDLACGVMRHRKMLRGIDLRRGSPAGAIFLRLQWSACVPSDAAIEVRGLPLPSPDSLLPVQRGLSSPRPTSPRCWTPPDIKGPHIPWRRGSRGHGFIRYLRVLESGGQRPVIQQLRRIRMSMPVLTRRVASV